MAITAGMKDVAQEIASSYDARVAGMAKLKDEAKQLRKDLAQDTAKRRAEVRAMRDGFQASHKEMAEALRRDLARHRSSQKEMSTELKKGLAQSVAGRKSEVKGMLNDFQSSHRAMSAQLRKSLAQSEAERKQASAELRKELANYIQGIKSEVARMRRDTKADLDEARTAWQELASTMQAKRTGVKVPPAVKARVEEKAEVPVAEAAAPDLEAKLLAAVREHPAGITLAEVAESLGVAVVVLGRAARKLVDEGKVRREERLYFPVSAE